MAHHQAANDIGIGRNHPTFKLRRRKRTGPAVKQLDGLCAGFDLARQIIHRHRHDAIDQRLEARRILVGQAAGFGLIFAAMACDHVGRDRPWAAGKAQHRHRWINGLAHLGDGFIDLGEVQRIGLKLGKIAIMQRRSQLRAFAGAEAEALAHGVRDDQDVGKQDSAIHAKALERLDGDLGRGIAVVHQFEEAALFGPQGAIFRQITPSLAHQPDGRRVATFALQHGEQRGILMKLISHDASLPVPRRPGQARSTGQRLSTNSKNNLKNCQL